MSRPIVVVEEEDWYVAHDIRSGVASQGKTLNSSITNLREALELFYEGDTIHEENAKNVFFTTMEVVV